MALPKNADCFGLASEASMSPAIPLTVLLLNRVATGILTPVSLRIWYANFPSKSEFLGRELESTSA
jgi:hypothetical protein